MVIIFVLSIVLNAVLLVFVLYSQRKRSRYESKQQQHLVQVSEQKLAALYQLSPLPILLNRFRDGVYVEANQAMSDLVGYSLEEVKHLSYWDLTPEIYAEAEQEQLKSLTETGRYGPYQKQYRHKAGHLVDIELNGMLFDGLDGEKYIWTIIKDISAHKKLEKLKDDFVSTVSHELRTPLTSISGSLSLVMGGAAGEFSERAEKLLSIAYKNSQRLNLLINDLLDIEKLVAGKVQFEPKKLAVVKLLKEAVEQTQPLAASKNISLKLPAQISGFFWADEARLLQVLANFLSNAIKYSPENGEVELSAEHHDAMMRITVKDQGPGITQSEQFKLFQRFSQLNQAKAGTGLGLAISKEIITLSGGQVGVNSTPGQGASFWFELPLYEDNTSPTSLPHILVIEDDQDTASLLKAFLEQAHYAVTVVADCQSAWQKLNTEHFAALTLDLKLKQESGADFFLKLRDNPATAALPVLIISAFTEKGKLQLGALSHAVDWLAKPIMPDLLYLKLNRLLATLPRMERNHRILHIEDDSDIVTIMQLQLAELCDYQSVATVEDAQKVLKREKYDLILLDLGLPDGNGLSLLPMINQSQGDAPVVIFSAQDVSQAKDLNVEAVFSKSRINIELLAKYLKQILHK